jgi:Fanconi anemia group M protein
MASHRTVRRIVTFCREAVARLCHVVVVVADVREIPSGVPKRLEGLDVSVSRKRLQVGDYVVGSGAIVERKSVLDLQDSLIKGRLWIQIGRLREVAVWPYLLIEGASLDKGPISAEALRGLWLAVSDLGVVVLRSSDVRETALWLHRLAVRRQQPIERDRPAYTQRFVRARPHPAEAARAAAPGISVKTARALLDHFGSLNDVITANPAEWQSVAGVGPHRSHTLWQMVHSRWHPDRSTSHSHVSRNGRHAT